MIAINGRAISGVNLAKKSISAVYAGAAKAWPETPQRGIVILDYIETDGRCVIPLADARPAKDMVIASSFYVAQDAQKQNIKTIFYGTDDGAIMMSLALISGERRIISYGYMSGGISNVSYTAQRPQEPTHYMLVQNFGGAMNYTAFYSHKDTPYSQSDIEACLSGGASERLSKGYSEGTPFPGGQILSIFGLRGWGDERNYMTAGGRFYGMKARSNGRLAYDFVPAMLNDECGVYDRITGAFSRNAGAGTLTGGES